MFRLAAPLFLFAFAAFGFSAIGQETDAAIAEAARESLLSMPEPPLDYSVVKRPVVNDGKLLGFQVQIAREGVVDKALVTIEFTDRSDRRAKMAACKGYVNGFVNDLKGLGFKLAEKKIPDFEKSDFKSPLVVDLTFANDEGTKLLVRKRVFFTNRGHDVTIVAQSEEGLESLSRWAEGIAPALSLTKEGD